MFECLAAVIVFSTAVALKGGWLEQHVPQWKAYTRSQTDTYAYCFDQLKMAWSAEDYVASARNAATFGVVAAWRWFCDGSILSTVLVMFFASCFLQPAETLLFAAGYFLINMSMGEEAGAIGDYKNWWGDYRDAVNAAGTPFFTRSYGVKKAVQYGALAGGVMALALGGAWPMWLAGAAMPAAYFIGNSLHRWKHGTSSWTYSEPLWGALLGLGFALSI